MRSLYFIFISLIFVSGCKRVQFDFNEIPVKNSEQPIIVRRSEVEIDVPNTLNFKIFDISRDNTQLIIMNVSSKKIEIYDLKDKKMKWNRSYKDLIGDIDKYGSVESMDFIGYDSIFFLQSNLICLSDTMGIKDSIRINSDDDIRKYDLILTNLNNSPIFYNHNDTTLSIQAYCYSCGLYNKSFYLSPINISFNLKNHKIIPLPISYSGRYSKKYYGFHNLVYRREYTDKYLISFSAEPNLYVYDKSLDSVIVKGGRSKYQVRDIMPLELKYKNDSNKKLKHFTLEPMYKEFLYDRFRNLYYRFFSPGLQEKNPDGTFNGWQDRELVLMIFDSDLNLIKEVNLGKGVYSSYKSFIGEQGLYLYKYEANSNHKKKNKLRYEIFEID